MPKEKDEDQELTMVPVVSTNIDAVGWLDGTLRVAFNSGHVWEYEGVPQDVYENLRDAGSVGGYFARAVKGRFTGREV